jgi:hypothetical protein
MEHIPSCEGNYRSYLENSCSLWSPEVSAA